MVLWYVYNNVPNIIMLDYMHNVILIKFSKFKKNWFMSLYFMTVKQSKCNVFNHKKIRPKMRKTLTVNKCYNFYTNYCFIKACSKESRIGTNYHCRLRC